MIALDPGLCGSCQNAARIESARGSVFYRCTLADTDPRFRKYPQLPVRQCPGHRPEEGAR